MSCVRLSVLVAGVCLLTSTLAGQEVLPKYAVARIGSTRWRVPDTFDFAIAPDSKAIALPFAPKEVRFWDAQTGNPRGVLSGPVPNPGLVYTPDGKQLLVKEDFDRLRLWDIGTGKAGKEFVRKDDLVGLAAIAPDGKWLVAVSGSAGKMKDLTVWGVGSGRAFFTASGDARSITGLAISPDSGAIATVGTEGKVILRDPVDGTEIAQFAGPKETHFRTVLAFSADGKTLISAAGGEIVRWDLAKKAENGWFKLPAPAVAITTDGSRVAVLTGGKIEILDTLDRKIVKTLGAGLSGLSQVRFAPDGSYLAALTNTGQLRIWDLVTGMERGAGSGHAAPIQTLQFLPDGIRLLSAGADNTMRLWEVPTGKEIRRFGEADDGLQRAVASPDGKVLAGGGGVGSVAFFDTDTGKQLAVVKDPGLSFAFAPDGKTLVSLSNRRGDEKLRIWYVASGMESGSYASPPNRPANLSIAPDGKRWAVGNTATGEQLTHLLDPSTGKTLNTVEGRPVAWTAQGTTLVTLDQDGLLFWDTATGKKRKAIPIKGLQVVAATASADGKRLAYTQGSTVTLCDDEGKELAKLTGHENTIEALAFSADGKWLASGGKDTTILLWDLTRLAP